MPGIPGGQKALATLELELWTVVSCRLGAGKRTSGAEGQSRWELAQAPFESPAVLSQWGKAQSRN